MKSMPNEKTLGLEVNNRLGNKFSHRKYVLLTGLGFFLPQKM